MPATTATKSPASRAPTPKRVPTATKGGARGTAAKPSPAAPAVPEDLERFFPGFEQILMQGVGIALPEVIKLFGGSRGGTADEQEAAPLASWCGQSW
jgi:hypothetical protein